VCVCVSPALTSTSCTMPCAVYVCVMYYFYNKTSLNWSGNEMEIQHVFCEVELFLYLMSFKSILVAARSSNGFAAACLLELWFQMLLGA
jgi:hypothetical protein